MLKRRRDGGIDQDRVLAVNLEHAAVLAEDSHRLEDRAIGEAEVEDHERLGRGDPGLDHRGQLGQGIVHPAEDRRAEREVDGAVGRGHAAELRDAGEDRAMGRRR